MALRFFFILSTILFSLTLSACSGFKQAEKKEAVKAFENYPKVIAVLPFANDTEEIGIAGQVRKSFYNHFSSKPFQDIELSVTDSKVAGIERSSGKTIFEISAKEAGEAIGADGVIYGRITDYKKVYALAYSQIGVEAEVWMVDARTGEELWRVKDSARFHEGGLPLSPMGAVMTVVTTAVNLREIQHIRVVNEIGWKLNEQIPVPEGLKIEQRPLIKNVISNAKESPFGKGKTIKVAMEGDKGLIGLFDVMGLKKAVPFKEVAPGEYLGEYMVVPGDNVREAPLAVYLRRPTGEEAQWLDISGFLTVDTTAPASVTELKGKAFIDRVDLSWKGVAAPDLRGYKVYRSKKPLSDYEEAGFTEEPIYADKTIEPKEPFYYRVSAVDAADNESDRTEPVKLTLREREVVELSGAISKDTVLNAGVYLVKGALVVEAGATLTFMPDTKVYFDSGSSLKVLGSLVAQGENDLWIEFLPRTPEEKFNGISFLNGAGMLMFTRVSGAVQALTIENSPVKLSHSVIENNTVGISLRGIPSAELNDNTLWHNGAGLKAEDSRPGLSRNEITQNGTGIIAVNSYIDATDNNIYANEVNGDFKGHASALDRNYVGSVNTAEMRLNGDVKALKVYDAPFPKGKLVDALIDPYAAFTPQQRKDRLAELLAKGGKYFKDRNFGKAVETFEEALKVDDSPVAYYYLALSYQDMEDTGKALGYLEKGSEKYPLDSSLVKAYGLLLYQLNMEDKARASLKEALRLNPGDKQIKFILERIEAR